MPRAERTLALVLGSIGAIAAIARLRAMQSLSPPDLAFFHQATWSAAHGHGFTQTALEFDSGALFGSIHLSMIRALWVPLYALMPAPETLVGLQGALLMGGTAAVGALVLQKTTRPLLWLTVIGIHPMIFALGTCDLRPLTFVVVPALLAVAGLFRSQWWMVALGVLGAIAAREESWMVLLGMVPFAVLQARIHGSRLPLMVLLAGMGVSWLLPRWAWGHGANITANADPMGTLQDLLAGERPWLRWPVELYFAFRCLVVAWPAVRCPELLLPALAGWASLCVFSEMEPAAPEHGGLHYLSVLAPLLIGAATIGWRRFWEASSVGACRWWTVLAIISLGGALPELVRTAEWCHQSIRPTALADEVDRIRAEPGGVLTVPRAAPLLSGRPLLRIQGHFAPAPTRIAKVAAEVDHALLHADRPPEGPPAAEWDQWQKALPAAGLHVRSTVEGVAVWGR